MRGKYSGETNLRQNQQAKGHHWGHTYRYNEVSSSPKDWLQTQSDALLYLKRHITITCNTIINTYDHFLISQTSKVAYFI